VDRFHGRGHSFRVGLGPAKAAWKPLKKLLDLIVLDGRTLLGLGRIRNVCGHGNLIANIVGELRL
jgi:hypothetical protein